MTTPVPTLDLSYADPAPPSDLAARAQSQGKRIRLRQRARAGLVAVAGVALVFGLVARAEPFAAHRKVVESSGGPALPVAVGKGPTASSIISGGLDPQSVWGEKHVVSLERDVDGRLPVLYVTSGASLCQGTAVSVVSEPSPSACQPLGRLPHAGFFGGVMYSKLGNLPSGTVAHVVVAGLVRGDVTRVVVQTPAGDVEANLAATKDPRLGQLYWAETPLLASEMVEPADIRRVAFEGSRAAFACTTDCGRD